VALEPDRPLHRQRLERLKALSAPAPATPEK
ncbi:MAG: hypothetical protein RIT24_1588, partial [Planctomycetota bacterium]